MALKVAVLICFMNYTVQSAVSFAMTATCLLVRQGAIALKMEPGVEQVLLVQVR